MELKATLLGKHLAQHPYHRVKLLAAGVEVSGERHQYVISFNQLLTMNCKRGLVWGELEFVLLDRQVVRLHGTEWHATVQFYYHAETAWRQWNEEMAVVAASVLNEQHEHLRQLEESDSWLTLAQVPAIQVAIEESLAALPISPQRLDEFAQCQPAWAACQRWLNQGAACREQHNHRWAMRMLETHSDFFATIETTALNRSQALAVVNGEQNLLVRAGAGSGKTSVLVARAGWLLTRQLATAGQILLLAFGRQAAQEIQERITARLNTDAITAHTFHALALHIIGDSGRKTPQISELESDDDARQALLIACWQNQCQTKKAHARGWSDWLSEEFGWVMTEDSWWQDDDIVRRLVPHLDRWLGLMRSHGGSQAGMLEAADEELRPRLQKRLRLMAPLLKAWKQALKAEQAVDFSGLIHQAIDLLEKGRFVSPWKHILVDEFQDLSPQRATLLKALRRQNTQAHLFAVGDDRQAIYRFSGAQLSLTTEFISHFGAGECSTLDTTYRFNSRIGEVANQFIQQNPAQQSTPLRSLTRGERNAVVLMPEAQLEALLDKMSGFVAPGERIMILARYRYLRPVILTRAATRWPRLTLDFMTIHASKGQQADYVIVLGLNDGSDGFPAPHRTSVIELALLPPPEAYPDAEERRLLYVALTRARHRVWLLFNPKHPSTFVTALRQLDVPVSKKP